MIPVTIRVDEEIIKTIDRYFKFFDYRPSFFIRDLIEIGISTKIRFNICLNMQLNTKIPIDDISLSDDQARLNFYLEPALLDDAKEVFSEKNQSVLRKALRLAIFRLINTTGPRNKIEGYVPPYQISIEANKEQPLKIKYKTLQDYDEVVDKHRQNMRSLQYVSTYFVTTKTHHIIKEIFAPFLSESSKKQILIVTGPRASGKTHLIEFCLAIANNQKLAENVKHSDLMRDLNSFAGRYKSFRLIDDAGDLKSVIKGLEKYESLLDRKYTDLINYKEKLEYIIDMCKKEHLEKQLIIYKEIENPEDVAKNIEMIKILGQYSLKIIVETNNASVVRELVGQLPSTVIITLE